MSISIEAPLKGRLVQQLSEVLKSATVYSNLFVSTSSLVGLAKIKSLPDKGALAEELRRYIGDTPFTTFIYGEANTILPNGTYQEDSGVRPLVSFDGYADTTPVAQRLVDSFCSLPWSYHVTIRLPASLRAVVDGESQQFELSPRHRIVSGSSLISTHPLADPIRASLLNFFEGSAPSSGWDESGVYLQVDIEGYCAYWPTEPFMVAREEIYSFFGLGLALGLFVNETYGLLGNEPKLSPLHVHRLDTEKWVEHRTIPFDELQQKGIHNLSVSSKSLSEPGDMLHRLERMASVFRSSGGKNIILSSRWLFDSHCGRDELLSYVQAAVAIEILLGDEDADHTVGLTNLMANRCAYLIAQTPSARASLLRNFRDIYKVRSKIVHRGKSRLTQDEVRLFHMLQSIIRAVIDKEQRLLARAEDVG